MDERMGGRRFQPMTSQNKIAYPLSVGEFWLEELAYRNGQVNP